MKGSEVFIYNTQLIRRRGGMADALDSKSSSLWEWRFESSRRYFFGCYFFGCIWAEVFCGVEVAELAVATFMSRASGFDRPNLSLLFFCLIYPTLTLIFMTRRSVKDYLKRK